MEESESMVEDAESIETSRVLKLSSEKEEFISNLTMGIEDILQAHPMIKDVKMVVRPPANTSLLTAWERRYGVRLPSDLRGYYSSTNGFRLTWSLVYADEVLKVGNLSINTIQELRPIETILEERKPEVGPDIYSGKSGGTFFTIPVSDVQKTTRAKEKTGGANRVQRPFGPGIKAFHLDSSYADGGSICLVYKNDHRSTGDAAAAVEGPRRTTSQGDSSQPIIEPEIQIWFLDRSYHWHFLAHTFNIYYRMAFFHLGLPDWMHRFTPYGLSLWTEQIYWLVAPKLLQPVKHFPDPNGDKGFWASGDIPPEAANPNPVQNVLNISMFKEKKKVKVKSK